MRRHVRTFKNRFEEQLNVTKFNTIRPPCKRPLDEPQPGDLLDCRVWSGRPYHSPMRQVCYGRVTANDRFEIIEDAIGRFYPVRAGEGIWESDHLDAFAKADGFFDWRDMRDWFEANHGLPFNGRLIKWEPIDEPTTP